MKNIITALSMLLVVSSTARAESLTDDVNIVIKSYTSAVVAAYACRTTLEDGKGQYHHVKDSAEEAFTLVMDNKEKAQEMIKVLENRIENEDPTAQLARQFDEVNAPSELRKQSCEKMVNGNIARANEAREMYKIRY